MARKWIALGLIAWGLVGPAGPVLAQYPNASPAPSPGGTVPFPAGAVQAPPGWPGVDPNCVPPMAPQAPPGPGCEQPVCFTPSSDCINPECCPIAWLTGEWLGWRIKDPRIPFALVTSGTTTLVDAGNVHYRPLSGGRLDWGVWFSRDHVLGMDFTGFGLESATKQFSFSSDINGNPPLNFLVRTPGGVQAVPVSAPGTLVGSVNVGSASRLWGGEASLVSNVWGPLTLFAGFRYLHEEDAFEMSTVSAPLGVVPATATFVTDHFSTRNTFYGGELGGRFVYSWGAFWVGAQAKAAYGQTHQVATPTGSRTVTNDSLFPVTTPVGRYVTPANAVRLTRNTDGFVPEGQVKIGYQLDRYISISAGYDFLYWNRVLRASEQFSGGAGQPLTPIERTFWAQGITAGLEIDY